VSTCVIEYNPPRGAPKHVEGSVTVKGVEFPTGKRVTVSAELAFSALSGYPKQWWTVHSGEPVAAARQKGGVKQTATQMARAMEVAQISGDAALGGVPRLSAGASKIMMLGGEAIQKALDEGALDGEASHIAVLLWMMGDPDLEPLARAAAIRSAKVAAKAAA
jgi:hypothetical protein